MISRLILAYTPVGLTGEHQPASSHERLSTGNLSMNSNKRAGIVTDQTVIKEESGKNTYR